MRVPFFIYDDLACLLEEIHSCQSNNEKSYTGKLIPLTNKDTAN